MKLAGCCFAIFALCGALLGQAKPAEKPTVLPPDMTVSAPIYPLPLEERSPMRDLQLQWDEIELDNQHKLLEIEKNHERQDELKEQMKVRWIKYAQKSKIDLDQYETDPDQLRFVTKKPLKP